MGSVVFDAGNTATRTGKLFKPGQKPSVITPTIKAYEVVGISSLDEVEKLMACILCQKISNPDRLMICELGHILCAVCHRKNPTGLCPMEIGLESDNLCRHPMVRFKCPVYAYFYDNSLFKCPSWTIGCPVQKLGKHMNDHEKICPYRPSIPCIIPNCKDVLVSPFGYGKHFKESHKAISIDSNAHRFQLPCGMLDKEKSRVDRITANPNRWVFGVLNCFGLSFLVVCEENEPVLHIWVIMTQMSPRPRKLKSRIGIACEKFEKSWTGPVPPFGRDYMVTLAEEDTFIVGKGLLQKHFVFKVGGRDFWNLDVHITEDVLPEPRVIPDPIPITETEEDRKPKPKPRTTPKELYEKIFGKTESRVILEQTNPQL